ncbi:hypothetical protein H4R18_001412 [Coemansia javaensis]|uniref:Uncharacterized protein n=1 Tax=Coemansia javaensis TaxID=2761396 RepID=A0A9W8HF88_9FUNG|nr:hypothetical protein H4R18_001412 [Coemansia javaensis]
MSEEGEAELDAGQIREERPAAPGAGEPQQSHAEAASEQGSRREARSRSRASSRGRDHHAWRGGEYSAPHYDSPPPPRRRESRGGEGEHRGGPYGRPGRYGEREREGYRAADYGRRFKRRESGRGAYSRFGYGSGEEGGPGDDYMAQRDMDKERAIEELRSRVRARPADEGRQYARARSRDGPHAAASPRPRAMAAAAGAEAARPDEPTQPVDMDDLEEGEHVEGAMDMAVDEQREPAYARARDDGPRAWRSRSRSRMRPPRERSRSRSHSASRRRAYGGPPHHEPDERRAGSYRDYADGGPRRRYDERPEYRQSSPRHHPRYEEPAYQPRYAGRRAAADYPPERREYSGRGRRYDEGSHSPGHRWPRSRSRSRSPQRDSRADHGDRYQRHEGRAASRPAQSRSRSPRGYGRESAAAAAPADDMFSTQHSDYQRPRYVAEPQRHGSTSRRGSPPPAEGTGSPPPPPPPPPLAPGATHDQPYGAGTASPAHADGSPYRGFPPRSQRRASRTARARGREYSQASTSGGRGHDYGGSRAESPAPSSGPHGPGAEPPAPDAAPAAVGAGTDLVISRYPGAAEWLAVREQVREQRKRVLELAARARRTGFELAYADWGVQKADSLVQLAVWQLERAEQGLGASTRSLIEPHLGDL